MQTCPGSTLVRSPASRSATSFGVRWIPKGVDHRTRAVDNTAGGGHALLEPATSARERLVRCQLEMLLARARPEFGKDTSRCTRFLNSIALCVLDPQVPQSLNDFLCFRVFRHGIDAEVAGESDNGAYDRGGLRIRQNVRYETAVDFDTVYGKTG